MIKKGLAAIDDFMRTISALTRDSKTRTKLYQINTQLFDLDARCSIRPTEES